MQNTEINHYPSIWRSIFYYWYTLFLFINIAIIYGFGYIATATGFRAYYVASESFLLDIICWVFVIFLIFYCRIGCALRLYTDKLAGAKVEAGSSCVEDISSLFYYFSLLGFIITFLNSTLKQWEFPSELFFPSLILGLFCDILHHNEVYTTERDYGNVTFHGVNPQQNRKMVVVKGATVELTDMILSNFTKDKTDCGNVFDMELSQQKDGRLGVTFPKGCCTDTVFDLMMEFVGQAGVEIEGYCELEHLKGVKGSIGLLKMENNDDMTCYVASNEGFSYLENRSKGEYIPTSGLNLAYIPYEQVANHKKKLKTYFFKSEDCTYKTSKEFLQDKENTEIVESWGTLLMVALVYPIAMFLGFKERLEKAKNKK